MVLEVASVKLDGGSSDASPCSSKRPAWGTVGSPVLLSLFFLEYGIKFSCF